MKYLNHEAPWLNDDLSMLYFLATKGESIKNLSFKFQRSPHAIQTALRKIITKQMIYNPIEDVAHAFNMNVKELNKFMGNDNYNVPLLSSSIQPSIPTYAVMFYAFFSASIFTLICKSSHYIICDKLNLCH